MNEIRVSFLLLLLGTSNLGLFIDWPVSNDLPIFEIESGGTTFLPPSGQRYRSFLLSVFQRTRENGSAFVIGSCLCHSDRSVIDTYFAPTPLAAVTLFPATAACWLNQIRHGLSAGLFLAFRGGRVRLARGGS